MVTQRPSKQLEWSFWLICNRLSLLPYLFFLFPQLSGQMTRFTSCFLSLCFLIPLTVTSWTRPVWAKATCATSMQPHHTAGDSMVVTCVCFAATAHTHTHMHTQLSFTSHYQQETPWVILEWNSESKTSYFSEIMCWRVTDKHRVVKFLFLGPEGKWADLLKWNSADVGLKGGAWYMWVFQLNCVMEPKKDNCAVSLWV